MKLYYSPGACSLAAHIVAEEADLGIVLEKVDLKTHTTQSGADYYAINPKGHVPALRLDDGGLLSENVAILSYLGDRKPELGLAPAAASPERYILLEWLAFINGELHKAFAPLFKGGSADEQASAKETILKRLAYVDQRLADHPYLLGKTFGVADAYLFVMLTWSEANAIDLSRFEHLRAFKRYVSARKSVQAAQEAEGLI